MASSPDPARLPLFFRASAALGDAHLATGGEAIFTPQPFVLFGESVVSVNPCVNTCLLFGTSILEVFTGKIRGKWKFTYDFSGG